MAKRVLLLRHAQSEQKYTGIDKKRPLTHKGLSDAIAVGCYIRDNDLSPDYVLCSDALRTKETLEKICESLQCNLTPYQISLLPILYMGQVDDYLSELRACDDDVNTVLLIGHMPKISIFARMLASPLSDKKAMAHISGYYEPATLSIFSCEIDKWKNLRYEENTLIDVVSPNNYTI